MKNIENSKKNSFLKRIFIKLSRKLGFEIIDQNTFKIVTLDKKINDEISVIGKSSINLPLGKIDITRPVKALDIIIRTCASVNMLTQNKKRLFEKQKIEYTSRAIYSILNSVKNNSHLEKIKINFKVIDHNSSKQNLEKINSIFKSFDINYDLINLDVSKFENEIENLNERGEKVSTNQMSNMANINKSLLEAKKSEDLIYFVEDDYLHQKHAISEMIFTYERLASQINKDLILCPTDYPYLYAKADITQNFLGHNYHWRKAVSYTHLTLPTTSSV